jgi:hypothetical protein
VVAGVHVEKSASALNAIPLLAASTQSADYSNSSPLWSISDIGSTRWGGIESTVIDPIEKARRILEKTDERSPTIKDATHFLARLRVWEVAGVKRPPRYGMKLKELGCGC